MQEGEIKLKTRSKEKRCHYCGWPGHFIRECEKKTKDMAKEKGQSLQMQLKADVTESWVDIWPKTTQTDVEGQLNTGDTYPVMARSPMEDDIEKLNLQGLKIKAPAVWPLLE